MEEKSLEEMMADISSVTTTASTSDEMMVIDGSTIPFQEPVQIVSQSPIESTVNEEVQEMIEAETFMSKNINKDMPTLEREFVQMEREAAVIDKKIDAIKAKYADVFKEIAELEVEKDKILAPKEDYREVIARKLFLIGEKKWKGMEVEFSYVGPSFKDKFNQTKFKEEQPVMYAKYVEKNPVKEYIKTKLSLLPIVLDEEEK